MYAIFENGSKQYKASIGDVVKVEKLDAEVGGIVYFPVVMTVDGNAVNAGKALNAEKVTCEVVSHGKDKKIIVFKYKAKKNERKKQGHRQPFTQVKVVAIGEVTEPVAPVKKVQPEKKAEPKPQAPAKKAEPVAKAEPFKKTTASKTATAKTQPAKKTASAEKKAPAATKPAAKKPAAKAKAE